MVLESVLVKNKDPWAPLPEIVWSGALESAFLSNTATMLTQITQSQTLRNTRSKLIQKKT